MCGIVIGAVKYPLVLLALRQHPFLQKAMQHEVVREFGSNLRGV